MTVRRLHQQGEQRKRSAFAAVVGAQKEEHIFQRHDDRQRPEHQRDDADDFKAVETVRGNRPQSLLEGIERAGADIAIDDPHGAE